MRLPRAYAARALLVLGCWLGRDREALALEPGSPFDEYVHAAWPSVAHASALRSLVVARDGQLWIGTSEGLVRFDGTSMVTFDRQRAPGIADGPIEQVFEASDGALWVGSRGAGLSRLGGISPSTVTSLRQRDGLPGDQVRAFAETGDGTIWVATHGGVATIARGSLRPQDASDGLPDPRVEAIAVEASGTVWAGTRGGLARWDPPARRWQPEGGHPALAGRVLALLPDPDGTLWVATPAAGLLQRRGSVGGAVWRAYTTADGLGSNEVSALLRERGGRLWAATRNGGLAWRAGERFQPWVWPVARCAQSIEALAEDAEGALWIGTRCGLHRIRDRPIAAVTRRDGLPVDAVRGLNGGADGTIWIGTRGGGMARIAPGRRVAQPIACGGGPEACAHCWDISPAPDGAVWAVCENSELRRWDGRVMAQAPLPPGIDAADMVAVARDGAVWIARGDQVIRWHQGVAQRVAGLEQLTGRRIPYQGPGGTMWIAADDGVAAWRDGHVVRVVRFAAGAPAVEVSNLHEDGAGALWIGTLGAGLRLVRGESAATIGLVHGLPTDRILQILEDDAGRLWLSSRKGLLSVPRRELEEVADGRRARVWVSVYDGVDGVLVGADGFGHPAGWKDREGRLWFATSGGVALVDPAALRSRAPAPRVLVQHLLVDGRRVAAAPPAAAVIGPGASEVEAVFQAPSLAAADTILLRYRLEGRDADWVEAGASRSAHYNQLVPGRYRLTVQARHRDGDWSQQATSLDLVVRGPFYRSLWFGLLVVAGVGLLLAAAHRLRLARARAALAVVMAERARISRDIHDTLAEAFVATSVRLECLDQAVEGGDRAIIRRHLAKARSLVKASLEEARRAVWVLRPQVLEHGLPAALEGLRAATSGNIVVELELEGTPRPLPPMVEANLLRIAQEGVANAYRHARASRIVIKLSFAARAVVISVIDDGTGLETGQDDQVGQAGVHRGLAGMRERAADLGGRLTIAPRPGGGTAIELVVPA